MSQTFISNGVIKQNRSERMYDETHFMLTKSRRVMALWHYRCCIHEMHLLQKSICRLGDSVAAQSIRTGMSSNKIMNAHIEKNTKKMKNKMHSVYAERTT